jgi:hypothetical protein
MDGTIKIELNNPITYKMSNVKIQNTQSYLRHTKPFSTAPAIAPTDHRPPITDNRSPKTDHPSPFPFKKA